MGIPLRNDLIWRCVLNDCALCVLLYDENKARVNNLSPSLRMFNCELPDGYSVSKLMVSLYMFCSI